MNREDYKQTENLIEASTRSKFVVLGFRLMPVNPNDYGMNNEADNPIVFSSLKYAFDVSEAVTKQGKEMIDPEFEAKIARLEIL